MYDEGNSGYNRDEVIGLKDYEIASLTDEEIAALQMMEQEFFNTIHEEIVLVAWKKTE